MKKIRLNMDTLAVESFACTSGDKAERGTVHGRNDTFFCYSGGDCTGLTCQSCENCTINGSTCSGMHVCLCPP